METTYELIKATKGLLQGRPEDLRRVYDLSLNDIFFQMQFVMCEEQKITDNLEKFYVDVNRSLAMIGSPENIANWLNELVHQNIATWIRYNRPEMLNSEERGIYVPPSRVESFVVGHEAEDIEYTRALEHFLCRLPEIHKQMAVAYYYDDMSMDKMEEIFMIDSKMINNRITYIEKSLAEMMGQFCKEHRYTTKNINSQRIRTALIELASLYKYPYEDALFENVKRKIGR